MGPRTLGENLGRETTDTLDGLIRTNCRKGIEGLRQKGWTLIITGSSMEAAIEDEPSMVEETL